MFPTLFSIGSFSLQTINIWLLLGFIGGGFLIWKRAHDEHYEDDQVFDVMLVALIVGIIFARIAFILFHLPDFKTDILAWFSFFTRPGFNEFIGILVMLVTARRLAIQQKWDEYEFLDFMSIGSVWFLICVWIGRFFAGAYLGLPSPLPWAMMFPSVYDARHPVQVYFVAALFLEFIILMVLEKRYRFFQWYKGNRQSAQSGFVAGMMIFLTGLIYSSLRFFLQEPQKVLYSVPLEALTPFILGIFGLVLIYLRSGRGKGTQRTMKLKQQRRLFSRRLRSLKG